jgi:hypothetical protein
MDVGRVRRRQIAGCREGREDTAVSAKSLKRGEVPRRATRLIRLKCKTVQPIYSSEPDCPLPFSVELGPMPPVSAVVRIRRVYLFGW